MISLPHQPDLFEKALVTASETILLSKIGISFLAHMINLIQVIRGHHITKDWIAGLEEENRKRQEALKSSAIDALEAEWLFLWKKYPIWESKKALLHIKHSFTRSGFQVSQAPFDHACFLFREFKVRFNCNECSKTFRDFCDQHPLHRSLNNQNLHLELIQTSMEQDPVYFWQRLTLLEKIFQFCPVPQTFHPLIRGKWNDTKNLHWERATDTSTQTILRLAKETLWIRFGGDGFINEKKEITPFLKPECMFTRTACENYLRQLLVTIRLFLLSQPSYSKEGKGANASHALSKRERKESEVIDLASAYWKVHPLAKHDEVYADYQKNHKERKGYAFESWVKIIRERGLDPRQPHEKTRGNSKIPR